MERVIKQLIEGLKVYLDGINSLTTREQKSEWRRNENNLHGMMRIQIAKKQRNGFKELIYTKESGQMLLNEVLSWAINQACNKENNEMIQ